MPALPDLPTITARIKKLLILSAMENEAEFLKGPTFVFRPGATNLPADGNVYSDWPTMMTAVGKCPGPKWIEYDPSIQQCIVPAGTWNVDDCHFMTNADNGPSLTEDLYFAQGAHFTFVNIYLHGNATFHNQSTSPVWTQPNLADGGGQQIYLYDNSVVMGDPGAAVFFNIVSTTTICFIFMQFQSTLGDGTNNVPVISVGAGASLSLVTDGPTTVNQSAIGGTGNLTCFMSGAETILAQTVTHQSLNEFTQNFGETAATVGGAAASQTIATPNTVSRFRVGFMRVTGTQSVTTSQATTVTFQLFRDTTAIGPAVTMQTTAAEAVACSITHFDTLPDSNNHTYKIVATPAGGTVTQANNSGNITWQEL